VIVCHPRLGKTSSWKILRQALESTEGKKISTYVIDPKALTKDELYGRLDSTTLEWTDGVFTHILRKILDNVRGEQSRNHWIILDGDVDPNWVENLNSVLDDNKLLTLPNGERLALTPNIRIMFEVQNLNYATPATVSRCGMVWYSSGVVTTPMIMLQMLRQLKTQTLQLVNVAPSVYARWKSTQVRCVELLEPLFGLTSGLSVTTPMVSSHESVTTCFILNALHWVEDQCEHIMTFSRTQNLVSLFSMLKGGISKVIEYNDSHSDFPLSDKLMDAYLSKYLVFSVLWAFGGSLSLKHRLRFSAELLNLIPPSIALPDTKSTPLIDFEVKIDTSDWGPYEDKVDAIELDSQKIVRADVVIDTIDTARHTDVINSWLTDHRPLILCGPPGSGKSMTLTAVLRSLPEFELVTLNFSSTTTPKLLLDTLSHYCKTERTPNGLVMHPVMQSKWLVIFCDEINLPQPELGNETVAIITFLRQLAEHGGFWRASDVAFVKLDRIQFIGACNPPTDAGRVPLSPRFLRHCPLLFVDFPAVPSLRQIYGTFNRALLKLVPSLRSHAEPLTEAMIDVYSASQTRFTPDQQSHYIYSPRELSRWVRAMYEAMKETGSESSSGSMTIEELVRLWLHEALRLFQDRLVFAEEREWTDRTIDSVAKKYWPNVDHGTVLARPVLFSNWLTKNYTSVAQSALRDHVKTRLRVFYEEELDVKLVIFDEVLDHILRIDRVLRQPLGHLLLVGVSGGGKTVLSKFVSWMQGMSVFQIKVHKHYSAKDFDKDLRSVLTRAGCKGERICFIFDESNVLNTAFLERMNALLAGGEVPGLFEGQDFTALMAECQ
jgi:dynein heavy chain 1